MPARDGFSTLVALSSTWRPRRAAGSDVVRARSQLAAVASASASLKTRESAWRFEGRRADPLARPAGRPRSMPGETRSSRQGRGARTRAIRHATAATAAPSGSAARQRLARRLEPVFCSARRLLRDARDISRRLERAWELAWGRPPSSRENERACRYLATYSAAARTSGISNDRQELETWTRLARILLTADEFLYFE